jgi:4-amino-4-deoxy-L-arabinose transferase-like glycosyltransferase
MTRSRKLIYLHLVFTVVISGFLSFYNLGNSPQWGSYSAADENRHIRVAQEMKLSGDWWTPTLDGEPYFLKPPLKMWLTALITEITGESYFGFRLLDAVLGVGIACVLYLFALELFSSPMSALFAVLFLLGNKLFFFSHGVRSAVQDTFMLFLTSCAMWLCWRVLKRSNRLEHSEQIKKGILFGTLIGCAALAKSVVAYYPYFLIFVFLLTSENFFKRVIENIRFFSSALLVSIVLPALFFVPHLLWTERAYEMAIHHEILERLGHGIHHMNAPDFYLHVLRSGVIAPYWVLITACLYFGLRFVRTKEASVRILLIWFLLPLTAFSILPSRMEWYLAPSYLAIAMILGETVARALRYIRGSLENGCLRKYDLSLMPSRVAAAIFLILAFSSGVQALHRVAKSVLAVTPPLELAQLTDTVVKHPSILGKESVISFHLPPVAMMEHIYLNTLQPKLHKIESLEGLKRAFENQKPEFVLSSLEESEHIIKIAKPHAYFVIPPCLVPQGYNANKRYTPLIAFYYGDGPIPQQFIPLSRPMHLAEPFDVVPVLGWEHLKKRNWVIKGGYAALLIKGDYFLEYFGGTLKVDIAGIKRKVGKTVQLASTEVHLAINGHELAEIQNISPKFQSYYVDIPPHLVTHGQNLIGITPFSPGSKEPVQSFIPTMYVKMHRQHAHVKS